MEDDELLPASASSLGGSADRGTTAVSVTGSIFTSSGINGSLRFQTLELTIVRRIFTKMRRHYRSLKYWGIKFNEKKKVFI